MTRSLLSLSLTALLLYTAAALILPSPSVRRSVLPMKRVTRYAVGIAPIKYASGIAR